MCRWRIEATIQKGGKVNGNLDRNRLQPVRDHRLVQPRIEVLVRESTECTGVATDLQYVRNAAYNRDRGPVLIPGFRLHVEL